MVMTRMMLKQLKRAIVNPEVIGHFIGSCLKRASESNIVVLRRERKQQSQWGTTIALFRIRQ